MRSLLLVPALFALVLPSARAQRLPAPFPTLRDQVPQFRPTLSTRPLGNPVLTVFGGVLGGTAGLLAGARLGAGMQGSSYDDDLGALYGALFGEAVGLAAGAHLGDGLRGNLGLDLLASAGGSVIGLALVTGASDDPLLLPAAALQAALVAVVELANARSKLRNP